MFACSLEPLEASIPPQKGTGEKWVQDRQSKRGRKWSDRRKSGVDECTVENISRLSALKQPPLLLCPHRGHISADESKSLFEVVLRLYPYILHLVIEGPESEVGGLEEWDGGWDEVDGLSHFELEGKKKKKDRSINKILRNFLFFF